MSSAPADQAAALKIRLDELVAGAGARARELPDLGAEGASFKDYWDQFMRWLDEQLRDFFPSKSPKWHWDPASLAILRKVLAAMPYVIAGFVIVLLLGLVIGGILTWLRKDAQASDPALSRVHPQKAEDDFAERLRQMIAAENWSAAARWRWRLFLRRRSLPQDQTPRECALAAADLERIYPLMFGAQSPDGARAFAAIDGFCTANEGRA